MTDDQDVFARLRVEYSGARLREDEADPDGLVMARRWFDAAAAAIPMANAMSLATVDADGQPSTRIVLLKELDDRGFVFFTNYRSRKGRAIEANPRVGLCMWWEPMHRQLRAHGVAETLTVAESDAYFASRPRESNLSGMASEQSAIVASRRELEDRRDALRAAWDGRELERPEHWGGYRVVPSSIELWQGQPDRLHDRLRYRRRGDGWVLERLGP